MATNHIPFGQPLYVYLGNAYTHWGRRVTPSGARIVIPVALGRKWLTLVLPTSVEVVKVPVKERVGTEEWHTAQMTLDSAQPMRREKWPDMLDAMRVTFKNIDADCEKRVKDGRTPLKWPKKLYRTAIGLLEKKLELESKNA